MKTAESEQMISNISRVGEQSTVLAKVEEERLIKECAAVVKRSFRNTSQQRCEKQANGAGGTFGSYFVLQLNMETKRRCTESRSNRVPAESTGSAERIADSALLRELAKNRNVEAASEGDLT